MTTSSKAITARFGATVRNLRLRLGVSQEELAERAELHRTYIAGIEAGGRNLTLKSITKLASALEVSTSELLAFGDKAGGGSDAPSWGGSNGKIVEILLVEDNPDDVKLTLHAFEEVRIANHVHVVSDGAEALDYLFCIGRYVNRRKKNPPQIILLDLGLPKISGMEVLRRIKSDHRTKMIPVIVLTVSRTSRDIIESRQLGAETYIVKPVDFYNFSRVTPDLHMEWALFKRGPGKRSTTPGAPFAIFGKPVTFIERSAPTRPY